MTFYFISNRHGSNWATITAILKLPEGSMNISGTAERKVPEVAKDINDINSLYGQ